MWLYRPCLGTYLPTYLPTTLRGTLLLQLPSPTLPVLSCIFPSSHPSVASERFEICENHCSRQDFLSCQFFPVCSGFLHSYFARKLDLGSHRMWIFLFALFWGRLPAAFTKERCVRSLSLSLSLSKIASSLLLHWSPKHNNNMWIWKAS